MLFYAIILIWVVVAQAQNVPTVAQQVIDETLAKNKYTKS